jgi:Xaa-Pro aminopeptidase
MKPGRSGNQRVASEALVSPVASNADLVLIGTSDRRTDVDSKMARVATLLKEAECEGLLLLEPENVAWLTSGLTPRGLPDPSTYPAVYCNGDARWLFTSNVDSQRQFDEELDGLGFQLKEWPWHLGRDQLIADLCQNRHVACDRPLEGRRLVAAEVRRLRLILTPYEQACYRALGAVVAHALEATCRTLRANETEREVAGQLSHRLMHRGTIPLHIGVAADGRSRLYRSYSFTNTPIQHYAVLTTTARKYGLTLTAGRALSFGDPDEDLRREHNAVCRVSASFLASTWPDAVPREILAAARRIYQISGYEHEWLLSPQGHVTGRRAVEISITPQTEELFQPGMAVTWHASAGAAESCDTFLVTDQGPKALTPSEGWPLKRIRIQGAELIRPDILQR